MTMQIVEGAMRLKASITQMLEYHRAMIVSEGDGTYLFLFKALGKVPCDADYWFEMQDDALEYASDVLGIAADQWTQIPDRLPQQQQDLEYDERGELL
jgi:hypothetical protein